MIPNELNKFGCPELCDAWGSHSQVDGNSRFFGGYDAVRIGPRVVGLLKTEDGDNKIFRIMDNNLPVHRAFYNGRFEALS